MIHIILVDVNASGSLGDTPLPFGGEAKRYAFLIEQAGMISPTYERLQNRNFHGREYWNDAWRSSVYVKINGEMALN